MSNSKFDDDLIGDYLAAVSNVEENLVNRVLRAAHSFKVELVYLTCARLENFR